MRQPVRDLSAALCATPKRDRAFEALLTVIVALTFACIWSEVFQFHSWCDELLTVWVIKDSLTEAFNRALQYQGSSPLYFLIGWILTHLLSPLISPLIPPLGYTGINTTPELTLRGLSAFCTIVTTIYIYRMCRCFCNRETSLIACQFFQILCLIGYGEGFSGRPYALAVMCAFISLDCYLRWILFRNQKCLWGFFLSSLMIPYLHPFFNVLFLVHAIITAVFWHHLRDRLATLLKASLLFIVLAAPNLYQIRLLSQKAKLYADPGRWSLTTTLEDTHLQTIVTVWLLPISVLWFWSRIRRSKRQPAETMRASAKFELFIIALSIAYSGAIALSAASLILVKPLFTARYALYSLGGFAIGLALLNSLLPQRSLRLLICCYTTSVILLFGHKIDPIVWDWPGALQMVNENRGPADAVLIDPCLAENKSRNWSTQPENREYLLSLVTHYQSDTSFFLFPWELPTAARSFSPFPQVAEDQSKQLWILLRSEHCHTFENLQRAVSSVGFSITEVSKFGEVQVLRCRSPLSHISLRSTDIAEAFENDPRVLKTAEDISP